MGTFSYPSNTALQEIEQVLAPQLIQDDLLFQIMPMRNEDATMLMWDQMDDYIGLQQIRGLNGQPPKVQPVGAKTYVMQPGVYGEQLPIDEKKLTERRPYGQYTGTVSIDDLVMQVQAQLLQRRINRIKQIGWTLLTTGTFSVSHAHGGVHHTDTFSLLTASAAVDWDTVATATPLADFRALQLLGPANGANFGGGSLAIMNRTTFNKLLSVTNANDIAGRRTSGLATVMSQQDINMVLAGEDLPTIVIYDDGYKNDAGTFTRFIATDKVVVVGRRPAGQRIAEYLFTRNANNPGMTPGPYMKVVDKSDREVPIEIVVHDGHNGGPVIYFPGSIVILSV